MPITKPFKKALAQKKMSAEAYNAIVRLFEEGQYKGINLGGSNAFVDAEDIENFPEINFHQYDQGNIRPQIANWIKSLRNNGFFPRDKDNEIDEIARTIVSTINEPKAKQHEASRNILKSLGTHGLKDPRIQESESLSPAAASPQQTEVKISAGESKKDATGLIEQSSPQPTEPRTSSAEAAPATESVPAPPAEFDEPTPAAHEASAPSAAPATSDIPDVLKGGEAARLKAEAESLKVETKRLEPEAQEAALEAAVAAEELADVKKAEAGGPATIPEPVSAPPSESAAPPTESKSHAAESSELARAVEASPPAAAPAESAAAPAEPATSATGVPAAASQSAAELDVSAPTVPVAESAVPDAPVAPAPVVPIDESSAAVHDEPATASSLLSPAQTKTVLEEAVVEAKAEVAELETEAEAKADSKNDESPSPDHLPNFDPKSSGVSTMNARELLLNTFKKTLIKNLTFELSDTEPYIEDINSQTKALIDTQFNPRSTHVINRAGVTEVDSLSLIGEAEAQQQDFLDYINGLPPIGTQTQTVIPDLPHTLEENKAAEYLKNTIQQLYTHREKALERKREAAKIKPGAGDAKSDSMGESKATTQARKEALTKLEASIRALNEDLIVSDPTLEEYGYTTALRSKLIERLEPEIKALLSEPAINSVPPGFIMTLANYLLKDGKDPFLKINAELPTPKISSVEGSVTNDRLKDALEKYRQNIGSIFREAHRLRQAALEQQREAAAKANAGQPEAKTGKPPAPVLTTPKPKSDSQKEAKLAAKAREEKLKKATEKVNQSFRDYYNPLFSKLNPTEDSKVHGYSDKEFKSAALEANRLIAHATHDQYIGTLEAFISDYSKDPAQAIWRPFKNTHLEIMNVIERYSKLRDAALAKASAQHQQLRRELETKLTNNMKLKDKVLDNDTYGYREKIIAFLDYIDSLKLLTLAQKGKIIEAIPKAFPSAKLADTLLKKTGLAPDAQGEITSKLRELGNALAEDLSKAKTQAETKQQPPKDAKQPQAEQKRPGAELHGEVDDKLFKAIKTKISDPSLSIDLRDENVDFTNQTTGYRTQIYQTISEWRSKNNIENLTTDQKEEFTRYLNGLPDNLLTTKTFPAESKAFSSTTTPTYVVFLSSLRELQRDINRIRERAEQEFKKAVAESDQGSKKQDASADEALLDAITETYTYQFITGHSDLEEAKKHGFDDAKIANYQSKIKNAIRDHYLAHDELKSVTPEMKKKLAQWFNDNKLRDIEAGDTLQQYGQKAYEALDPILTEILTRAQAEMEAAKDKESRRVANEELADAILEGIGLEEPDDKTEKYGYSKTNGAYAQLREAVFEKVDLLGLSVEKAIEAKHCVDVDDEDSIDTEVKKAINQIEVEQGTTVEQAAKDHKVANHLLAISDKLPSLPEDFKIAFLNKHKDSLCYESKRAGEIDRNPEVVANTLLTVLSAQFTDSTAIKTALSKAGLTLNDQAYQDLAQYNARKLAPPSYTDIVDAEHIPIFHETTGKNRWGRVMSVEDAMREAKWALANTRTEKLNRALDALLLEAKAARGDEQKRNSLRNAFREKNLDATVEDLQKRIDSLKAHQEYLKPARDFITKTNLTVDDVTSPYKGVISGPLLMLTESKKQVLNLAEKDTVIGALKSQMSQRIADLETEINAHDRSKISKSAGIPEAERRRLEHAYNALTRNPNNPELIHQAINALGPRHYNWPELNKTEEARIAKALKDNIHKTHENLEAKIKELQESRNKLIQVKATIATHEEMETLKQTSAYRAAFKEPQKPTELPITLKPGEVEAESFVQQTTRADDQEAAKAATLARIRASGANIAGGSAVAFGPDPKKPTIDVSPGDKVLYFAIDHNKHHDIKDRNRSIGARISGEDTQGKPVPDVKSAVSVTYNADSTVKLEVFATAGNLNIAEMLTNITTGESLKTTSGYTLTFNNLLPNDIKPDLKTSLDETKKMWDSMLQVYPNPTLDNMKTFLKSRKRELDAEGKSAFGKMFGTPDDFAEAIFKVYTDRMFNVGVLAAADWVDQFRLSGGKDRIYINGNSPAHVNTTKCYLEARKIIALELGEKDANTRYEYSGSKPPEAEIYKALKILATQPDFKDRVSLTTYARKSEVKIKGPESLEHKTEDVANQASRLGRWTNRF